MIGFRICPNEQHYLSATLLVESGTSTSTGTVTGTGTGNW